MKATRYAALMCAAAAFVPASAFAQAQNDCDLLLVAIDKNQGKPTPLTRDQVLVFAEKSDLEACRKGLEQINAATGAAGGSNIVVQQAAPTVTVDPATPQVTVQQAQPTVTVQQAQPEIIVRQPAPTVSIDIPQPEIIVRMPEPQVAVQQAQPQVQVQQAQPQVRVEQPEQPQVQVQEGAQPQVRIAQPEGQPNIQTERVGEPRVTYERAEPNVMINQAQGEPTIRIEPMEPQPGAEAGQQQAAAQATGQRPPAAAQGEMPRLTVSDFEGMRVINERGEEMGEVENLVRSTVDQKQYVVISHGGLLGLGEKKVALALDSLQLRGDQVVVPRLTDEQIKGLPAFDTYDQEFPEVEANAAVEITTAQN